MAVCRHARCRELALGRKLWVRALLSGPESVPAHFHWAPQPEREWVWGEAWESAFLTSTTWDLVALAHPSLPVSMGCGLAERVHVTLGGCRNSIPVHGSYQGVRTTLQQQTNQLKIPCKPREGGFCKRNNKKKKTKASHRYIQGHGGGRQGWGGTGNLPTAAASCRGVSE